MVALATALENQAVGAYQAALSAAHAGKLGTVPPAVATFATTAVSQHTGHAKAWNAVLTGAGAPAITNVPLSNQPQVLSALGGVTDVGGVAELALQLERQAAETYLFTSGAERMADPRVLHTPIRSARRRRIPDRNRR